MINENYWLNDSEISSDPETELKRTINQAIRILLIALQNEGIINSIGLMGHSEDWKEIKRQISIIKKWLAKNLCDLDANIKLHGEYSSHVQFLEMLTEFCCNVFEFLPLIDHLINSETPSTELMMDLIVVANNIGKIKAKIGEYYEENPLVSKELVDAYQIKNLLSEGGKAGVKITHSITQPRAQSDNERIAKAAIKLLSYAYYSYDDLIDALKHEVKPTKKKKFSDSKIRDAFKEYGGIVQLRKDAKKLCPE